MYVCVYESFICMYISMNVYIYRWYVSFASVRCLCMFLHNFSISPNLLHFISVIQLSCLSLILVLIAMLKVSTVRWLSVDGHSVDCHLGRAPLNCHLRRIVINVDTYVDCRYVALYLIPS